MKVSETPDRWVIIESDNVYKVFATWAGGYLYGDSWKANSGITKVTQDENYYYFYGYSGSIYKCNKKSYGFASSYGESVLAGFVERSKTEITIFDDREDWTTLSEKLK